MAIVKWNPVISPSFRNVVEDFFGNTDLLTSNGNALVPAVNIKEADDQFTIELAAPGMKKEDFKLEVDKGILSISREVREEKEEKDENYTRKEFNYRSFCRSFSLPENVNADAINATYEDGLLQVHLPKMEVKKGASRKIEIS